MAEDIKLVHVRVVGGTQKEIVELSEGLKAHKAYLPKNLEFLVTNETIELRDVKFLIDELYKLYKEMKAGEKSEEKK